MIRSANRLHGRIVGRQILDQHRERDVVLASAARGLQLRVDRLAPLSVHDPHAVC